MGTANLSGSTAASHNDSDLPYYASSHGVANAMGLFEMNQLETLAIPQRVGRNLHAFNAFAESVSTPMLPIWGTRAADVIDFTGGLTRRIGPRRVVSSSPLSRHGQESK